MSQNHTDGQLNNQLDRSLLKLADILKMIGVEQFSVSDQNNTYMHTVNAGAEMDEAATGMFCDWVNRL
jgi:hypothetical protein